LLHLPPTCAAYLLSILSLTIFSLNSSALNTCLVTHAAGRMGVSALGQLRESSPSINLIAIVRSKEEEERLKLDLCGAVLRDGKMETPRDMEKDLNIKVVVVEEDEEDEVDKLVGSMKSADTVVLLSASHAEILSLLLFFFFFLLLLLLLLPPPRGGKD